MSNGSLRPKPRSVRPCAICQHVRVEKTRVCPNCMELYGDQENEPWFQFCLQESEKTANLIRITKRKERPLEESVVQ